MRPIRYFSCPQQCPRRPLRQTQAFPLRRRSLRQAQPHRPQLLIQPAAVCSLRRRTRTGL